MDRYESISYALMARDFWRLVSNSCEELVKRGNPQSLMYEGWHWPSDKEWMEHTKWSDINIAQPVLFNFYHGIELSLKALLSAKELEPPKKHTLSSLYTSAIERYSDQRIEKFYSKYVLDENLPEILS
ncbi:HEPN domain-containing protein, partial [Spongiibacter marinus]|uniref:HEPN domain-containing protein n=1 Tax=Spongiibacter marinus TaxID=354246 RepID=UPI003C3A8284